MIYFVQHGVTGPVKIGYSAHINVRLQSLQSAAPVKLHLLGVMDGDKEQEKKVHEMFYEYRIRGEWFILSRALLAFIEDNCSGSLHPYDGDFDHNIVIQMPAYDKERLRLAAVKLGVPFVDMINNILRNEIAQASDGWIKFQLTPDSKRNVGMIAEKIGIDAGSLDGIADVIYFALRLVAMGFVTIPKAESE